MGISLIAPIKHSDVFTAYQQLGRFVKRKFKAPSFTKVVQAHPLQTKAQAWLAHQMMLKVTLLFAHSMLRWEISQLLRSDRKNTLNHMREMVTPKRSSAVKKTGLNLYETLANTKHAL
ncbi:hypothetical protein N5C38_12035 [Pseudomonas chengduensis]|jgi:hypothetical protein|nr:MULTISPECIES: hypothetical protein [Pseudomonas]MDH1211780.1 hypothetical protein [Pseudomonas chengduensis]MDH1281431.1 hypothetical protein [Pseudomonas chengduensis]MDH1680945.1 hypothetical protein [Pseudomonas chengduensis]NMY14466.1 hypothetical protein [Pseudomonas sp. WS 5019]